MSPILCTLGEKGKKKTLGGDRYNFSFQRGMKLKDRALRKKRKKTAKESKVPFV